MRSTLGSMKSTNMHSSIGGISSMSAIRVSNNTISRDSKFNLIEQIANFDKFFGWSPLTQKDIADIKKLGYTYRKYQNGDLYYGQSDNQRPQGQGLYIFSSISSDKKPYFYKGGFQNGEYHGFGKLCKIINDRQAIYCYQGNWKNGKRQGEGKENYNPDNTMFYKGSWLNDQRHGQGVLVMPDGNFEGMWLNGRMNGEGILTMQRGPLRTAILGQWFDDDINEGTIKYFSKSTNQQIGQYRGGIRNQVRDGQGVYKSGNIQLNGVFSKDQLTGYTQLKNTTNEAQYVIKGDYTRPQLVGLDADITYNNKDKYQGLVSIDPNNIIRRTKGKYIYNNGQIVEGQFDDNDRGELIIKK